MVGKLKSDFANRQGLSQKQHNGIIPYLIRNLCNVKIRPLWIPAFAGMICNLTFETAPYIGFSSAFTFAIACNRRTNKEKGNEGGLEIIF